MTIFATTGWSFADGPYEEKNFRTVYVLVCDGCLTTSASWTDPVMKRTPATWRTETREASALLQEIKGYAASVNGKAPPEDARQHEYHYCDKCKDSPPSLDAAMDPKTPPSRRDFLRSGCEVALNERGLLPLSTMPGIFHYAGVDVVKKTPPRG